MPRQRIWGRLATALLTGLAACLLVFVPTNAATAEEPPPADKLAALRSGQLALRVGTDATFPPFEFTDAGGNQLGFDIDLIRALAARAGIKNVEFVQMPFGNIVPALQADQIDVGASAIYISVERAKAVDFTDVYYPGGLAIFTNEKDNSISSLEDLAGKRVAVQVGTKSVEWLKQHQPAAQLVTVQTNEQMFSSARLGQADAVVTGAPGGKYFIAQQGGLKQVGDRLTEENYGYAFQKSDSDLRNAFNAALKQMHDDGSYQQTTDKWFGAEATAAKPGERPLFNVATIVESSGQIWQGLLVSLQVILSALVLSLLLGTIGGFAKLSRIAPLRWLGTAYVSVIRGTPFVVQLFFIYFGLPQLGLQLPPMAAGIIALGLYSGSYVTEIFRGAVQSVDRGQLEASRSCGMSHASAMRHVIIPQAFLRMLPPLGNEFVSMTKNSALVSFVTIHELFLVGQTIISRTFDALTVYLFIGLLYYLITNLIGFATSTIEKKMAVYI
ncbi:arginine/lysine/histidine/glutamine transport system substrate-binding and permease protein [Saccharopolyspora antimicrobica]|uniref:Arginine/lysine/histidine/glutamine transport system substrate-binding and permease protein n=1 Tax=Saccharopolyspora antimicrobica TaxID=455193 RepID=A0A1I4VPJ6_9PSEU|nr:ABC transporter substrate-binding protein/permease [Saccharopolyspora antimicrobica]RKT87282.1 L-histidine-binding protein /L-histidine ABC transporter membrane protein /L-arginine-binding protein /L-arginine ABC transporter membrane protein /L-lysine-binding protein /L-lysine ABC transporter membrane protein /L-glutamine-binding protein /L-glutamine ABC transporter membrane protein [Saccharopolyspora antimicrobica]SFN03005.1 arginine/lysine/histidine/glutamine transport system substrate-bindi